MVLILNQGLSFYLNASETFKASMAAGDTETLDIKIHAETGRPSLLTHLLHRARELTATWYVGGAQKTYAETGVEVSITGTNVASSAYVDYYIEGEASDSSGTPYRFLEGNNTEVTVGGDALDLDNQTTIENHIQAMGLSTEESHTIDYYVYVTARATGAVSGETLTTEITYTLFDSVTYQYGTVVTDTYQTVGTNADGYVREVSEKYDKGSTAQNVGDYSSELYDYGCWQLFYDVEVSQGTDLNWARLQWQARYRDGVPTVIVVGNDVDTAHYPGSLATFLSKARTSATANWTPGGWSEGSWYSGYCTDVVQEIIDRPGWLSGNDLMLFVEDDSEGWGGTKERLGAYTYNEGPTDGPKLQIRYMSYAASWYNIPPLSAVDLPVTLDVVAVLAVAATTALIVQTNRRKKK